MRKLDRNRPQNPYKTAHERRRSVYDPAKARFDREKSAEKTGRVHTPPRKGRKRQILKISRIYLVEHLKQGATPRCLPFLFGKNGKNLRPPSAKRRHSKPGRAQPLHTRAKAEEAKSTRCRDRVKEPGESGLKERVTALQIQPRAP